MLYLREKSLIDTYLMIFDIIILTQIIKITKTMLVSICRLIIQMMNSNYKN